MEESMRDVRLCIIFCFPLLDVSLDTVKIEDVLKNATERSAWIDFNGYMNTTMRYDYFDECE